MQSSTAGQDGLRYNCGRTQVRFILSSVIREEDSTQNRQCKAQVSASQACANAFDW